MIFGDDRKQLRKMYFDVWNKAQNKKPMTPLEIQIADVIGIHPEYHQQLTADPNDKIDKDYQTQVGESNPFLHMGLHLGLREQIATSRPQGIKQIFIQITKSVNNSHLAEHLCMDVLSQFIWEAQSSGKAPNDEKYLQQLKLVLKSSKTA
jgi:hypothetical protein